MATVRAGRLDRGDRDPVARSPIARSPIARSLAQLALPCLALLLGGCRSAELTTSEPEPKTAESPSATFVLATVWSPAAGWERTQTFLKCIEERTGSAVKLLQRETYDEANALLTSGTGDFGLICSGATVDERLRTDFVAGWRLVSDEDGGRYRATVLVRRDDEAQTLDELRGATFAWVDPNSLTGYHALRAELRRRDEDPGRFFGDARLTFSHDRSIDAVLSGVVRGAVVDEVVARQMLKGDELRPVWRSEYFPSPVFVVRKDRPDLASALEALANRRDCLEPLGADALERAHWDDYRGVAEVVGLSR